jgi:hypothetical protein
MKYGKIADNESINAAIYRCFDFVAEPDAKTYAKKFAKQPHDQDQVKHTLRAFSDIHFLSDVLNSLFCPDSSDYHRSRPRRWVSEPFNTRRWVSQPFNTKRQPTACREQARPI